MMPITSTATLRERLVQANPPPEIPSADITLHRIVGRGGMGEVYLGDWRGTAVAVKMVARAARLQPRQRQHQERLFLRETTVMASLRHPCICSLFGIVQRLENHTIPALVMEYLDRPLSDLVHKDLDAFEGRLRLRIMQETAIGLEYLHAREFMHRDIKTSNVMLDELQHAKVTDFGLSSSLAPLALAVPQQARQAAPDRGDLRHTRAIGTPRYMAPEILAQSNLATDTNAAVYDERCDVYSFGLLLWEVAHRTIPFAAHDATHVAYVLAPAGQRPPLQLRGSRTMNTGYDGLRPLIAACWHQDPAQRPTMSICVEQLGKLVIEAQQQPQSSRPSSAGSSVSRTGASEDTGSLATPRPEDARPRTPPQSRLNTPLARHASPEGVRPSTPPQSRLNTPLQSRLFSVTLEDVDEEQGESSGVASGAAAAGAPPVREREVQLLELPPAGGTGQATPPTSPPESEGRKAAGAGPGQETPSASPPEAEGRPASGGAPAAPDGSSSPRGGGVVAAARPAAAATTNEPRGRIAWAGGEEDNSFG